MIKIDKTPFGSFRVWLPKSCKSLALQAALAQASIWGGSDKDNEEEWSYELSAAGVIHVMPELLQYM